MIHHEHVGSLGPERRHCDVSCMISAVPADVAVARVGTACTVTLPDSRST